MYIHTDETCHATQTTENWMMSRTVSCRSKLILAMATLQQHPSICQEEMRKAMRNCQNYWHHWELNLALPKYKLEALSQATLLSSFGVACICFTHTCFLLTSARVPQRTEGNGSCEGLHIWSCIFCLLNVHNSFLQTWLCSCYASSHPIISHIILEFNWI
jgi:hypothetical protein